MNKSTDKRKWAIKGGTGHNQQLMINLYIYIYIQKCVGGMFVRGTHANVNASIL